VASRGATFAPDDLRTNYLGLAAAVGIRRDQEIPTLLRRTVVVADRPSPGGGGGEGGGA